MILSISGSNDDNVIPEDETMVARLIDLIKLPNYQFKVYVVPPQSMEWYIVRPRAENVLVIRVRTCVLHNEKPSLICFTSLYHGQNEKG